MTFKLKLTAATLVSITALSVLFYIVSMLGRLAQ